MQGFLDWLKPITDGIKFGAIFCCGAYVLIQLIQRLRPRTLERAKSRTILILLVGFLAFACVVIDRISSQSGISRIALNLAPSVPCYASFYAPATYSEPCPVYAQQRWIEANWDSVDREIKVRLLLPPAARQLCFSDNELACQAVDQFIQHQKDAESLYLLNLINGVISTSIAGAFIAYTTRNQNRIPQRSLHYLID